MLSEYTISQNIFWLSHAFWICLAFQTVLKQWQTEEISIPYVIIGNDTVALNAAQGIRLQEPKAKVRSKVVKQRQNS